jgi:nudix-type nucleoside diphosphatase (YffH/AdpP family)
MLRKVLIIDEVVTTGAAVSVSSIIKIILKHFPDARINIFSLAWTPSPTQQWYIQNQMKYKGSIIEEPEIIYGQKTFEWTDLNFAGTGWLYFYGRYSNIGQKTLSNKKYKLENISFQKPDAEGKLQDTETEIYRPDAAAVLMADRKHHKVLLTRQFRLPTFLNGNDDGYLVEVCAGLIPETESAEATARGEALEETGYQIGELIKTGGAYAYSSSGGILNMFTCFWQITLVKPDMKAAGACI